MTNWGPDAAAEDAAAEDTTAEDGTAEDATAELSNLGWTLRRSHPRYSHYYGRYGGLGLGLGYTEG